MTMPSTIHPVDRAPVRADDPATSQHAADTVDVPASWIPFARVALDLWRFTSEQVITQARERGYGYSPSRLRTCMREWEQYEWLVYTGETVPTAYGRRARVAKLTDAGFEKAIELTEPQDGDAA